MKNSQPLTVEQVSLILNISESTVKKLAQSGQLPCEYVNRRPQFKLGSLIKHFRSLEGAAS